MPSVTLSLPLHVIAKGPRKDGTYNVLFRVRRNAPAGWPSCIPLPITGRRIGNLNDPDEVARIKRDVEGTPEHEYQDGLLAKLERARTGAVEIAHPEDSLPGIAAKWKASWVNDDGTNNIRPRTQDFYVKELRILEDWSAIRSHRPLRGLDLETIMRFLKTYEDRPAQQRALRRTLSALFSFALAGGHGGVKVHPFGVTPRLRRKGKKRTVHLWSRDDVETYAAAALELRKPWAAAGRLLRLMWETSADATDVVTWRRDQHFRDDAQPAIIFTRGKTGENAIIPISRALAAELRSCGSIYFVTDPDGRPYVADDVHSDNRRGYHFRQVRDAVLAADGPSRVLDHLRHSAVTDAIEKGATKEHLPSLTAHRGSQMVDMIYSQMTETQAASVQRARGIIE